MSSPIDPIAAVEIAKQVAKVATEEPQSPLPFNFKKVVSVTRIETDTMERCHPKIIRSKKFLIFEKITVAHLKDDDGNLDVTPI